MAFKDYSATPAANTSLGDGTYIGPNMLRNKVRPALQQIAADGRTLYDEMETRIGQAATIPGPAGDVGKIATRSQMAAIVDTATVTTRLLTEVGREGLFIFSTANLSTQVASDPQQGLYVAPASDATGASGAWVRQYEFIRPEYFGAVATGLTDDAPAFTAMIAAMPNYGGIVLLSRAFYRFSSRVTVTKPITFIGAGAGTRSFVFGESQVLNGNWESYTGTVIVCDNDVAGLFFPLHTDVEDTATVLANQGATGSNATYWEYPGANGASLSNCVLYSKGGTSTTAHGIEARAVVHFDRVWCLGFGGDGFKLTASFDAASTGAAFGNCSASVLRGCVSNQNRGDGFKLIGRDANVIEVTSCEAKLNGGWGFNDDGFLGNTFVNCHAATNNTLAASYPARGASANPSVGSFRSASTAGPSVFVGCYIETGNGSLYDLTTASIVSGGMMSSNGSNGSAVNFPYSQRGGVATEQSLSHVNSKTPTHVAMEIGGTLRQRAFAYGTNDNGEDLISGNRSVEMRYYTSQKVWSLEPPEAASLALMHHPNNLTPARKRSIAFPKGIFFGTLDGGLGPVGPHLGFTSEASPPNGIYMNSDIIFRYGVAAGGKIGWVCTTSGVKAANWASGTSYNTNVSPPLADYVTNAGNVYRLTTKGGGTSTVAPVHGAGEVIGADGYGWTWQNASTAPVFKEWGVIDA